MPDIASVLKYLGEKQNKCDPFTFLLAILKMTLYSSPIFICFHGTEFMNQAGKTLGESLSFMVQISESA